MIGNSDAHVVSVSGKLTEPERKQLLRLIDNSWDALLCICFGKLTEVERATMLRLIDKSFDALLCIEWGNLTEAEIKGLEDRFKA